jgi:hypothetical protein
MKFLESRRERQRIERQKRRIIEDIKFEFKELKRRVAKTPKDVAGAIRKYQLAASEINTPIDNLSDSTKKEDTKRRYLMSSLYLMDSFALLNRQEVESLHFVTGPEVGETRVMDKIVDLKLEKQSMVYAKADADATRKALIYLSEHGHRLWACIHIHPGTGAGSTSPSGTDMTLDRLLLRGGYDCIGAIFSRDGFVRFFSSKEFEINIYGNGVEKISEKLYRLVEVN